MRNSETQLRAILDATPFPIAIVDIQDNKIDFWSRSALALFGHTAATAAEWYELAYPDPDYRRDVVERWKPFLEKARSSGQAVNTGEYRVTCHDGSVRICELHAAFLADNLIVTFNDITERKQAEENLKESHMLLRIAGETAKIGGWSVNLEENRAYWSDEVAAIHEMPPGYSPLVEEGISFYAPEWRERITKVFSDCSQKGIPYNEEMEIITAHGNRLWIQTIGEAVRNDKGIIYKVQGAFQDISERKQAESQREIAHEALKREQFLNNVIINSIPGAFYVLDENGRYARWNAYQRDEIIGKPEDQVAGANAADTIHPDDRELIKARIANVLGRGREEAVEGRVLLRGGPAYRWLLMTGRQIMIEGRPFLVGIGIDISERKRAESQREAALESLQESERKFRETVVTLDEGYYSVTLDGKLLEHNHAFNRIMGFKADQDLRGARLPDFWQDPDQRQEYLKAFAVTGSISNYLINAKTQQGKNIAILASAHLIKDEHNQPQRIEGVFLDISQRMRAEAEIKQLNEKLEQRVAQRTILLEAANMELEAFSYSVSHDLRAPLRAIDGFARIVLEEYAPKLDAEGRRLLGVITGNTAKMGRLIDDLLAFSRLSRQQMAPAPVSLSVMANVVYSELKSLEKGRRIEFTIGALPAAHGDYSMLYLVLQNLLANAIKFTRKKSRAKIELAGQAGKDENIYQVKDNGVGFDMEYAHKIFDVFQRLHGSDEFEGTGVGLAIVQRIVLRHGGRVWAESSKKGATFYFSLPQEKGTGDRDQGTGKREQAITGQKKK
jgi:PAS domain S-box-containing protein